MNTIRLRRAVLTAIALAMLVGTGVPSVHAREDESNFRERVFYWFPNRVLDLLDIFKIGIGFGPGIGAEVAATEKYQLGNYAVNETGVGWFGSSTNRRLVTHQGHYSTKVRGSKRTESKLDDTSRFHRGTLANKEWDIRAEAALVLVHPYVGIDLYEIGDFVTGFTGVDISKDDMQAKSHSDADPPRKLGRGIVNVATGIAEIPKNILSVQESHGGFAAISWGFFRGLKRFCIRELVGLYEIVTFPAGSGVIVEPEFPFEPQTSDTSWRLRENF